MGLAASHRLGAAALGRGEQVRKVDTPRERKQRRALALAERGREGSEGGFGEGWKKVRRRGRCEGQGWEEHS